MILRYARADDMAAICRVWNLSFGDSEEFIRTFFKNTGILSTTVVAETDGEVRSLMCAFDGIGDMSYLYALCTAPEYRGKGIGGKVLCETIRLAHSRGAKLTALHPADNELAKWYANNFGMKTTGYFTEEICTATETALTAQELPFSKLCGYDSSVTPQLCEALETISDFVDGKILRISDSIVYAENHAGSVIVKAIIHSGKGTYSQPDILSAVASYFSVSSLTVRRYSPHDVVSNSKHYVNLLVHTINSDISGDNNAFGFPYVLD